MFIKWFSWMIKMVLCPSTSRRVILYPSKSYVEIPLFPMQYLQSIRIESMYYSEQYMISFLQSITLKVLRSSIEKSTFRIHISEIYDLVWETWCMDHFEFLFPTQIEIVWDDLLIDLVCGTDVICFDYTKPMYFSSKYKK